MSLTVFEITLIALMIVILLSILWSTLSLGISPMPSSNKARQAILNLCDEIKHESNDGPIYELGSGWGHTLVALAKHYQQRPIIGYELSFLPWLVSVIWVKLLGLSHVRIYRQNFLKVDLSDACVIVCYLFSGGMEKLEHKFATQKHSVKYVISHHFALPSHQSIKTIELNDLYKTPVYLYRMNFN
ncbi:MAG: hypothetical protein ACJA1U_002958 [Bermanella sp.]